MKFFQQFRSVIFFSSLLISTTAFSDIEQERTNSVGRSDGTWETGLQVPTDDQANDECNIVAGLPFSCTLPTSGGGTVTCNPISIPGGVTLSSSCLLAGTSSSDFAIDVEFDDGVSDPVTKTVNLTAGPNQSPSASDPVACSTPKSGFAWSCDVASSVTDPEGQTLSYALATSAPSWASMSGSTISGTPDSSGNVAVPYTISDGVNIITYTYNISIVAGTAEAIQGDDPVSSYLLADAGVNSQLLTALSGTGCGSDGTESCLNTFNANKSGTSCTLAGGTSASADQITDYINCVIVEDATATAATVADTSSSTSAASGCGSSTTTNVIVPGMCGYSAWNCSVSNLPSDWTTQTNSAGSVSMVVVPGSTSASGTVNLSVSMNMAAIYGGSQIKTVTVPVNVAAAVTDAVNGKKSYVLETDDGENHNYAVAYDRCDNLGGNLGTLSDIGSASGNLMYQPDGISYKLTLSANGSNPYDDNRLGCYQDNDGNYSNVHRRNGQHGSSCYSYFLGGNSWWFVNGNGNGQSGSNTTYTCVNLPSC